MITLLCVTEKSFGVLFPNAALKSSPNIRTVTETSSGLLIRIGMYSLRVNLTSMPYVHGVVVLVLNSGDMFTRKALR